VIAGHFAFAAAVKSREQQVPLWALMLSCQWLDVVFVPLFVAGVERMEPAGAGAPNAYGNAIIHADYTHSLLGALGLSVAFAAVAAIRWSRRTAIVLGAVVFSHWSIDLIVHRPDLPFLPGNAGGFPLLGLGLWSFPAAAAALELAMVLAGAWLYWRAALQTGGPPRRANAGAATVLAAGVLTLALNLAGL
jgi:membrane-bound metal-dependent hydrolase YbcI (DUF457 family)